MEKSEHQIKCESGYFFGDWKPTPQRRKITKESKHSPCKVGEIVIVKQWGTFGCYDSKNRWVDFYNSEPVPPSWIIRGINKISKWFRWFFTGK